MASDVSMTKCLCGNWWVENRDVRSQRSPGQCLKLRYPGFSTWSTSICHKPFVCWFAILREWIHEFPPNCFTVPSFENYVTSGITLVLPLLRMTNQIKELRLQIIMKQLLKMERKPLIIQGIIIKFRYHVTLEKLSMHQNQHPLSTDPWKRRIIMSCNRFSWDPNHTSHRIPPIIVTKKNCP